jgi:ABC-type Na+ transport system ATPase subunit NatA
MTTEELKAEVDRMMDRLNSQATAFCRAHAEATKAATGARQELDLARAAAAEAEALLFGLLADTGEEAMPRPLRRRVMQALERVRRVRRVER